MKQQTPAQPGAQRCPQLCLQLEFLDYWLVGSGSSEQTWLDEESEKDHLGLPYVPGRSLKGVLREALLLGQSWGWVPPPKDADADNCWAALLFGSGSHARAGLSPDQSQPGLLQVGDACLSPAQQAALRQHTGLRRQLQRALSSTALDAETGAAREGSLRSVEVNIPITLYAQLHCLHGMQSRALGTDWQSVICQVLPLVRSLGKRRSRGFGRVQVRAWEPSANAGAQA